MKAHIVTLPGDYIGPEIVAQAVKVLNAVAEKYGHTFCFDERRLGGASIDAFGVPLTDETLAACNAADAVLMGSVGGPKWDAVEPARRPEKGLLALRKGMQVFANLRPCTIHPQLSGACPLRPDIIAKPIDIMILRELTGDIYFGKRWRSEDRAAATDEMAYSVPEVERLARIGFEMAKKRRGRLCSVDKANVLECSRLWRETVERLSREYPEVEVSFMYVDNAAMQLILNPAQFDVMITGNLFGDILSDESAAIAGSLGMMPSASLGSTTRGLYEPLAFYDEAGALMAYAWQAVLPQCRNVLLDYFAVLPQYRGSGVGTAVLKELAAYYAPRKQSLIIECEHPAEAPEPAVARRRIGFYLRAGAHAAAMESRLFGVRYQIYSLPAGGLAKDEEIHRDLQELYRTMVPEPYYRGNVNFFGA